MSSSSSSMPTQQEKKRFSIFSKLATNINHKRNNNKNKKSIVPQQTTATNVESLLVQSTYMSLLRAVLDPACGIPNKHDFRLKTFSKLTTCDECRSILWGNGESI